MPFIIGRKLKMTQVFQENGHVVPVTLVEAKTNVVTQVRQTAMDGSVSVQLGSSESKKLNKPEAGHVQDLPLVSVLREFRISNTELQRGDQVAVDRFEPGMKVHVTGISKGKGFAGVVKRHGFKGSKATHGNKDQLRMPGSIGSQEQAPPMPGKRMGGRMGGSQTTVKNLEIVQIDTENQTLAIKGAVPGSVGSIVLIRTTDGKSVWQS